MPFSSLFFANFPVALDKVGPEEEKPEMEDNAQTIRPSSARGSPSGTTMPLPQQFSFDFEPIEDYSDLAEDEDDTILQAKVAGFKVWCSLLIKSTASLTNRGRARTLTVVVYSIPMTSKPTVSPARKDLSLHLFH